MQARQSQAPQFSGIASGGAHGDSGSFTLQRNAPGGSLVSSNQDGAKKNQTLSNSPTRPSGESIKNKRVFIENTMDSIL